MSFLILYNTCFLYKYFANTFLRNFKFKSILFIYILQRMVIHKVELEFTKKIYILNQRILVFFSISIIMHLSKYNQKAFFIFLCFNYNVRKILIFLLLAHTIVQIQKIFARIKYFGSWYLNFYIKILYNKEYAY
jgi:hypothetical protein